MILLFPSPVFFFSWCLFNIHAFSKSAYPFLAWLVFQSPFLFQLGIFSYLFGSLPFQFLILAQFFFCCSCHCLWFYIEGSIVSYPFKLSPISWTAELFLHRFYFARFQGLPFCTTIHLRFAFLVTTIPRPFFPADIIAQTAALLSGEV